MVPVLEIKFHHSHKYFTHSLFITNMLGLPLSNALDAYKNIVNTSLLLFICSKGIHLLLVNMHTYQHAICLKAKINQYSYY